MTVWSNYQMHCVVVHVFNFAEHWTLVYSIFAGIKEELSAKHQQIYELLGAGKNKEVLEYYTEDCVIMSPGREAVQGKEG